MLKTKSKIVNLTDYQSKYFAYELTKRYSSDRLEKLASTFAGARVTLNPHQVDAALFAFKSPLSKGALLADEVGLGKTIEAGLVIAQKWAERKRKILVITPSNLRKQWQQELSEKFFLRAVILESKSYKAALAEDINQPFQRADEIVICSYQFAQNKADDIQNIEWDLVVIDEAHRLRNVYKPSNIIANTLKRALQTRNKILLTATPLQNSLLELFGLISFIDERIFGDLKSFRQQFSSLELPISSLILKERLKPVCHRTLREHVTAYVPFTQRYAIREDFEPTPDEEELYNLVSNYLRSPNLQALPNRQKSLMTLVMRKLLASSSFAIADTLTKLADRLGERLTSNSPKKSLLDELNENFEGLEETAEEWQDLEGDEQDDVTVQEQQAIQNEIVELRSFAELATSIEHNAKGNALLKVLAHAFKEAEIRGGAKKAIIFTEFRRTQEYLVKLLKNNSWDEGILLFNGTNDDETSKKIYKDWKKRYQETDAISGSPTADMRSALVEYFRDQGSIMIATEAGSEGINLQFCSLIINYDLPWNPQRIEQRIGRCHRYGQKHDVVVVNFLNKKNDADRRVFELLEEKFHLFAGVFGSSDEVLGVIESGVAFEKRIVDIYQRCRSKEEINNAFNTLQAELSYEIDESMTSTRKKLLDNFDDEVVEKFEVRKKESEKVLNKFEQLLMSLTRNELANNAIFANSSFRLQQIPIGIDQQGISLGLYELPCKSNDAHAYRLEHPLAEQLLRRAKERELPAAKVNFKYSEHKGKITFLKSIVGKSGYLQLSALKVNALDQSEDHLIFASFTDNGEALDEEIAMKLLTLPGEVIEEITQTDYADLQSITQRRVRSIMQEVAERNANFFEDEVKKLDGWADDQKVVLEREIKDMDRQIKEAKRAATAGLTLAAKVDGLKQVKVLESQRTQKRRSLFDAQDDVDRERDKLIANMESQLEQQCDLQCLFTIRWSLS
jgi:ERCC4-related helicase